MAVTQARIFARTQSTVHLKYFSKADFQSSKIKINGKGWGTNNLIICYCDIRASWVVAPSTVAKKKKLARIFQSTILKLKKKMLTLNSTK